MTRILETDLFETPHRCSGWDASTRQREIWSRFGLKSVVGMLAHNTTCARSCHLYIWLLFIVHEYGNERRRENRTCDRDRILDELRGGEWEGKEGMIDIILHIAPGSNNQCAMSRHHLSINARGRGSVVATNILSRLDSIRNASCNIIGYRQRGKNTIQHVTITAQSMTCNDESNIVLLLSAEVG